MLHLDHRVSGRKMAFLSPGVEDSLQSSYNVLSGSCFPSIGLSTNRQNSCVVRMAKPLGSPPRTGKGKETSPQERGSRVA